MGSLFWSGRLQSCNFFLAGLRCFSCDSETSDGLCDNSPGTIPYGTVECSDDSDEHCYTIRYEEQMENSISEAGEEKGAKCGWQGCQSHILNLARVIALCLDLVGILENTFSS